VSLPEDLHKQKTYFVRQGAQPANTDIKLYDVGNFVVATQGVSPASATCGELYVEYDVTLHTPVLEIASSSTTAASGTLFGLAPSSISALGTSGQVSLGTISVTSPGTSVATVTPLVIGTEYVVSYLNNATTNAGQAIFLITGGTLKTGAVTGPNPQGTVANASCTFVATATTATVNVSNLGITGGVNAMFSIAAIPTSTL
jgi:hypothetical protein